MASKQRGRPDPPRRLSDRDRQVARLVAEGRGNARIADELGITLDDAKLQVSRLRSRPGFDRREAIGEWYIEEAHHARRMRLGALLAVAAVVAVLAGVTALVNDIRGRLQPDAPAVTQALPAAPTSAAPIASSSRDEATGVEDFGPPDRYPIAAADLAAMQVDRAIVDQVFGEAAAGLVVYNGDGPVHGSPVGSSRLREVDGAVGQLRAFTVDPGVLGRPPGFDGLYLISTTVLVYQNEAAAKAELRELRRLYIAGVLEYEHEFEPLVARRVGPVITIVEVGHSGFVRVHYESAILVEILAERIRAVLDSLGAFAPTAVPAGS